MEIGIFGITANPPHLGHLSAVMMALERFDIDEIWITPVYNHAFKKDFLDYESRLEMLNLLLLEFPIKNVKIKELDKEYFNIHNDIVYSYNLLSYLKEKMPENNFHFVIGEDNYKDDVWTRFYKHKEIEDEFGVLCVPDLGVHSTQIRNKFLNNDVENIELYIGKSVKEYILNRKFYKG